MLVCVGIWKQLAPSADMMLSFLKLTFLQNPDACHQL